MEDTAQLLTDLDDFIQRARFGCRSRGQVAETLLKAITAELLPLARTVPSLQPALERIAIVARAMSRGERTAFDPSPLWPPVIAMDKPRPRVALDEIFAPEPKRSSRAPAKVKETVREAAAPAPTSTLGPAATVAVFIEQNRGRTFDSQRGIAKDLGISEATLSRQIKRLEKAGKVKRIKKTHRERAVAIL